MTRPTQQVPKRTTRGRARSWAQLFCLFFRGCSRICSHTVHRAELILNKTQTRGCGRMELLLPQCIPLEKLLPPPGPGENTNGSWEGMGERRHSPRSATPTAQSEIRLLQGLRSPPLLPPVFGKLRGTPQTRDFQAKTKENSWREGGSIPSQREHSG